MKEALDYLDELASDDEEPNFIYIEPPEVEDGTISGEDDGEEEEEAIPDNVCSGKQIVKSCWLRVNELNQFKTSSLKIFQIVKILLMIKF